MRIGNAAAEVGVAAHVLRHWEDVGVLVPPREPGGQRDYSGEHVAQARLVLLCQRAGLSLDEIKQLIVADSAGRAAHLRRHRETIAGRIDELQRADGFLEHTLTCAHPVVTRCPECSEFAAGRVPTGAARPYR
ncbi:MerR family transcriptional regulator [Tsukamurella ocularis]|uniref:MerR family transcriptional regulator n=1 Tax=Tsukamurella ocularis TaxID=1970234 RepID=UPI0039EFA53F